MNYSIDDDVIKRAVQMAKKNSVENSFNEMMNQVQDFQKKFSTSFETSGVENGKVDFKRLDEPEIDENKIRQDALDSLNDYKQASIEKIEQSSRNREAELNKNKEILNDNFNSNVSKSNAAFESAKQSASDDALKRGLSRSSIVINKLDAFNNAQIENYNKLNNELTSSINEIDFELNSLEGEKQKALDNFDIEYAYKLNEKISALTDEKNNKREQIIKYNNEIAKAEADYEIKYANLEKELNKTNKDNAFDLLDLTMKYGDVAISKYVLNQTNKIVENYLSGLNYADAYNLLIENADSIKNVIGENNYNSLVNKYGR